MIIKEKILQVDDLSLHYKLSRGLFKSSILIKAVDNISFSLFDGETLGIVGESGSGKSSLCRLILKLIGKTSGSIKWFNKDIYSLNFSDLREFRKSVQIIFQDPYGSLDPRMTIGKIIAEPLDIYNKTLKNNEKEEIVRNVMKDVGLSNELFNRYPHELSGGQCQRVGIARSLINKPSVLICDEPVSALDLSIQAQILDLIKLLKEKYKLTIFTDISCGYCRLLHSEIDSYLKEGLTINYLAFPRDGLNGSVYKDMMSAWCSKNPKQSLTKLKNGEEIEELQCNNPVSDHFRKGSLLGITGTPTIILEDGRKFSGYIPANELIKIIENG